MKISEEDRSIAQWQNCEILQRNYTEQQAWNYLIATISLKIRQSLELSEILQTTVDEVFKLLKCDRVLLYRLEPDLSGRVVVESVSDPQWSLLDREVVDTCFESSWLEPYQESRFVSIADVEQQTLTPCYAEFLAGFQIKANLVVPVLHASNLWGLMLAHNCAAPRQWQPQEIEGLQRIAVEVGIAIYQASLVDQLQAANTNLEAQVVARTQEIERVNQQRFQLAAIVESSQDAIISKTTDGIITSWNRAAEKLFGYAAEEMIGSPIKKLIPIELQEEEVKILQSACQGKVVDTYETQRLHKDGSLLDLALTISPIFDETGRVVGASKIVRDIRDRKQIEFDLKSVKEQLELVIEASSEGFWDWDLITGEMYCSPQWKEMLGYSADEEMNFFDVWASAVFEQDRITPSQLAENCKNGDFEQFSLPYRFRHKNGSISHILSRTLHLKDDQGNVTRIIGSHLDMTQLVEIQEALKISEMQLSSILDSSLNGIMAFRSVRDEQNKIIDFEWLLSNPTSCKLVDRSESDLIGNRLLAELPGNRDEGLFDLYVQVVESGEPMQHEFYYCQDGIDSWFENVVVKLGDGFVVTFRDVTAIKQAEKSLQLANQQLSDRLDDLKQRNAEMLILSEISDFLQACLTVQEACAAISSLVEPLFPNCSGSIFITNPSRNQVENVASWGTNPHSKNDFHPQDCWGLRRGQVHFAGRDRLGLRCSHVDADAAISNTLCIPMIAQGETLGLFYLSTETTNALPETKQQLAKTVAEQVALAITNLNLRETLQNQSIRDALTGLFNRRYLEESLIKEVSRAQRNQHSIGIVMIDIDHFKKFNDTFGHDAGDYVLQAVGGLLKQSIRSSDVACRYGGEELTLIFPETSLQETAIKAEIIRESIAQLKLSHNGHLLGTLTASLGVAAYPEHGATGATVIQFADAALYRAKAAGRDRVMVAP